ncbi:hypothetical protein [Aureimonas sp. AU4]|uniref:hypothetical protein n=1 Tax=Aureimonas sp. AU4 TaxID=1638163 RepID=UPI00078672F5|nr:hypothetical protein [Aureimonas sp. AU4]
MPDENEARETDLVAEWPFPVAATLGSAVRAKGIEQELRARLPFPRRGDLAVEAGRITLRLSHEKALQFEAARAIVDKTLEGIAALPVLPREIEDILTVTGHERLKWTRDGRLRSAGTRTVKLRGRAKAVTFHVFDPRQVEDLLDRDLVAIWREEDRQTVAENRRRAAGKAALTRAGKGAPKTAPRGGARRDKTAKPSLAEWDAFASDGLLR